MKKWIKRSILALLFFVAVVLIGFFIYVSDYSHGTESALIAMASTTTVTVVENDDYIAFIPKDNLGKGLIFYPGGKVEAKAYAPLMARLAESGIVTFIVKMPFNLAMFNSNGAKVVMDDYEDVESWFMSGHSLGGVFAGDYVANHPTLFDGMAFMASYPSKDMSQINIPILSITATEDEVLNRANFESAKEKLPTETTYFVIEGGNHGQFGDYGIQSGDGEAKISNETQREEIVKTMIQWLLE